MNNCAHFNFDEFNERMMDDNELMLDVLQAMVEDTPKQVELLRMLFESGDIINAGKAAHKIKGSAANVCCPELEQLAFCAEQAGKDSDSEKLSTLIQAIDLEWTKLYPVLKKCCEDLAD